MSRAAAALPPYGSSVPLTAAAATAAAYVDDQRHLPEPATPDQHRDQQQSPRKVSDVRLSVARPGQTVRHRCVNTCQAALVGGIGPACV